MTDVDRVDLARDQVIGLADLYLGHCNPIASYQWSLADFVRFPHVNGDIIQEFSIESDNYKSRERYNIRCRVLDELLGVVGCFLLYIGIHKSGNVLKGCLIPTARAC